MWCCFVNVHWSPSLNSVWTDGFTLYTLCCSLMLSNMLYILFNMDTTSIGEIIEQMLVKPTTSLNRMVTSSKIWKTIIKSYALSAYRSTNAQCVPPVSLQKHKCSMCPPCQPTKAQCSMCPHCQSTKAHCQCVPPVRLQKHKCSMCNVSPLSVHKISMSMCPPCQPTLKHKCSMCPHRQSTKVQMLNVSPLSAYKSTDAQCAPLSAYKSTNAQCAPCQPTKTQMLNVSPLSAYKNTNAQCVPCLQTKFLMLMGWVMGLWGDMVGNWVGWGGWFGEWRVVMGWVEWVEGGDGVGVVGDGVSRGWWSGE